MNSIRFDNQNIYPSKIICIGRNYVAHIEELNNEIPTEPVIFIKPNSAIANDLCTHKRDEVQITACPGHNKIYTVINLIQATD